MTTGAAVRLIFIKDARRYVWPLGMLLGIGLLIAIALFWRETASVLYVALPALSPYLIGLFLAIDLIQLDWPGRDLRFLSTRPVPGEAVFFAKFLFLGLFLVISGWGFQELDYAVLRMPQQPLDHLCLLMETTIHFGAAIALVVLFALFLRKNSHVLFALGLFFMAILLFAYLRVIFPGVAMAAPDLNPAQLWWGALIRLLGWCGFIGVVMVAAVLRYRTRRFGLPLALVIGGIILDLIICVGTAKIGESRMAPDRATNIPAHLRGNIRLTNYPSGQQAEQMAWNSGIVYHTVVRGPSVECVEPPYYYRVIGSKATATFRSGKIIHSVVEQTQIAPAQDIGSLMGLPFEADVIGVRSAVPGVSYGKPGITLRAFTYLPSRLPAGEDLTGVTIKGEVQLGIHRAYVAGSIPLEPGAVFTWPRQRYEITGVSLSPRGVVLDLTCVKLPLALRGNTGDNPGNLSWALVSRARNEILQSGSGETGNIHFPIDFTTSHMTYSKPGNNPLPSDWLKGAELVFLEGETCGHVTVPYEVDNVTLTR